LFVLHLTGKKFADISCLLLIAGCVEGQLLRDK